MPRTISLLLLLATCLRCTQAEPPWKKGDLARKPPELVVPLGAQDVDYRIGSGLDGITYKVTTPYPADELITTIAAQVASVGYKPLREHPMNPGLSSSYVRGWGDFVDGTRTPEMRVYQWMADWLGPSGEWLEYTLSYEFPEGGTRDVSTVKVQVTRIPRDQAEASIAAASNNERARSLGSLVLPAGTVPVVRGSEAP